MNTRSWLNRARNIDREIDGLVRMRDELYARLVNIVPAYDGDIVSGTKDPHKFDALAEIDVQLNAEIDRLVTIRLEIENAIAQLTDGRLREILRMRYLQGKTFEQIAVNIGYSYKQICRLHGVALLRMEEIIK